MRLHILSDLHTEIAPYDARNIECDVVVLSGDIGNGAKGIKWARSVWADKKIIYVPGNHEYYHLDRGEALVQMRGVASELDVHLLDNDYVVIDGVRFIGSTLWTDFKLFGEGEALRAMAVGQRRLNDFWLIRDEGKLFTPERSIEIHNTSVAWISDMLKNNFLGKTVVVTHHLPSFQSVTSRYKAEILSACFASRLSDDLFGRSALWIHGHTHDSLDYLVKGTRVLCNPRGYSRSKNSQENYDFNPTLVVEI